MRQRRSGGYLGGRGRGDLARVKKEEEEGASYSAEHL